MLTSKLPPIATTTAELLRGSMLDADTSAPQTSSAASEAPTTQAAALVGPVPSEQPLGPPSSIHRLESPRPPSEVSGTGAPAARSLASVPATLRGNSRPDGPSPAQNRSRAAPSLARLPLPGETKGDGAMVDTFPCFPDSPAGKKHLPPHSLPPPPPTFAVSTTGPGGLLPPADCPRSGDGTGFKERPTSRAEPKAWWEAHAAIRSHPLADLLDVDSDGEDQ